MKKITAMILAVLLAGTLAACGNTNSSDGPPGTSGATAETSQTDTANKEKSSTDASAAQNGDTEQTGGKALVAYFAYSENIGDTSGMEVDAITSASLNRNTSNTEGNLQIMAQVIEAETGGRYVSHTDGGTL